MGGWACAWAKGLFLMSPWGRPKHTHQRVLLRTQTHLGARDSGMPAAIGGTRLAARLRPDTEAAAGPGEAPPRTALRM